MPVLDDDGGEHAYVPRSTGHRRLEGVRLHRRDVPPGDVVAGGTLRAAGPTTRHGTGTRRCVAGPLPGPLTGRPLTTPLRTSLDLARLLGVAAGLVAADDALHRRLADPALLSAAAAGALGPGADAVRFVGLHADGRAASPLESLARLALLPAGLGPVRPQHRLERDGHPYDLGLPRHRVLLELDGDEHRTAARAAKDRADGLAAARAGWTLLRFGWHDVHPDASAFVEAVREVARRPWRRR